MRGRGRVSTLLNEWMRPDRGRESSQCMRTSGICPRVSYLPIYLYIFIFEKDEETVIIICYVSIRLFLAREHDIHIH